MARDFTTCEEFQEFKVQARKLIENAPEAIFPSVAISRSAGSRGVQTAHALKQYLDAQNTWALPWKVFESNLIDILLEQHHLPSSLGSRMPENKIPFIQRMKSWLDETPSDIRLFTGTAALIREILGYGHSIIVGRGADIIARELPHVLKIKLLASPETAIRRLAKDEKITRQEAAELRLKRDRGREGYVKHYYKCDYGDHSHFDLVIPTDGLRIVEVAEQIGRKLTDLDKRLAELKSGS